MKKNTYIGLDVVFNKLSSNLSICVRLVIGMNEPHSDDFMILFSKIQNVLKISDLPHGVSPKLTKKETI